MNMEYLNGIIDIKQNEDRSSFFVTALVLEPGSRLTGMEKTTRPGKVVGLLMAQDGMQSER